MFCKIPLHYLFGLPDEWQNLHYTTRQFVAHQNHDEHCSKAAKADSKSAKIDQLAID